MLDFLSKFIKFACDYPRIMVFALGGISSLAFAPFYFFPAAMIGFSGLVYLLDFTPFSKHPYRFGWWFGFGYFTIGLYWLANALKTVGLWYLMPVGWFGLPAFLALFISPVVGLTVRMTRPGIVRCLYFTIVWSVAEYLRGHILTGFPWNINGYVWTLPILQIISLIGIYGLSCLTTLLFVSFASRSRFFFSACIILFVGLYGWGQFRLSEYPTQRTGVNMRLVQASIPQNTKWLADHFDENFGKQLGLSVLEGERSLTAIIWPEASVPALIANYPMLMNALASVVPTNGYIIIGGPRKDQDNRIYTSSLVINSDAKLVAFYDKTHLVPFGEYFPFRKYFPFISKLTPGEQDYSPGRGIETIILPGLPSFSPLVCYEAIFPGQVVSTPRPDWMLNQTNDAWYGDSTGPFQHLQIVRTRAIEEGIPLVRSANNGISAVVDSVGRLTEQLGLNEFGYIDFDLPKPLAEPTLYSKIRDFGFWLVLVFLSLFVLVGSKRSKQL